MRKLWLLAIALISLLAMSNVPSGLCYPSAGLDHFDTTATVELQIPSLFNETIAADGLTTVARSNPYDPGDGHIMINTEIVSMSLSGMSVYIGPVTIAESATKISGGTIRQVNAGQDFPADSFFDVYVEIGTIMAYPNNKLHNNDAVIMYAKIYSIPPYGANYLSQTPSVELYNEAGDFVGYLKHVSHLVKRPGIVGGFTVQADKGGHDVLGFDLISTVSLVACAVVLATGFQRRKERQKK